MRKCSHCGHNGHNSRTCPNRGLKLFGVRLTDGIRKSASMGNLSHCTGSGAEHGDRPDGYVSEDCALGSSSSSRDRKKGIPWTEEEHRMFLLGLQKLGKGDWKGISRNFVVSRTPTQVASHAQKYFLRQSFASRRKRRSSLFDIVADESGEVSQSLPEHHQDNETYEQTLLPEPHPLEIKCKSMSYPNLSDSEPIHSSSVNYPAGLPACFLPVGLLPYPIWSHDEARAPVKEMHEIIKPTPVHLKTPINVDDLLGISELTIGESLRKPKPDLSLKLIGQGRQSAFHKNSSRNSSDVNSNSSPVTAAIL